jgi:ElaB/YqjD/DUF883 family membrane-anchored ribosome-binding protein
MSVQPEDMGRTGENAQGAKKPTEQIQETVEKAAENVQQTVNKAKENVQQAVSQVGAEAQKAAENVQHGVSQAGTEAWRGVSDASRNMREAAYGVKESASNSLLNAAEGIRREAVKGGNDEVIRQAHKLARSMEKAAVYLDSHTFDQIGTDAAETVRENPWQALSLAFIIGLLLGMLAGNNRD